MPQLLLNFITIRPLKKWFDWRVTQNKNEGRLVGIFLNLLLFFKATYNHLFLRTDFWLDV